MIHVKVPKEIKDYEGKYLMGLTKRQMIYFLICIVMFGLANYLIPDFQVFFMVCFLGPFTALGFCKKDDYPMDKYLKYIVLHFIQNQKLSYIVESKIMLTKKKEKINLKELKDYRQYFASIKKNINNYFLNRKFNKLLEWEDLDDFCEK